MSQWASGQSLTPSTLNAKLASASSVGGFSTNTLQTESGNSMLLSPVMLDVRAGGLHLAQYASQNTRGVDFTEYVAVGSGTTGRVLQMSATHADDLISFIVVPGANRSVLSGRNAQIIIYGVAGNNAERFGMTYYNGGWVIDSTANGNGVVRPIDFTCGSASQATTIMRLSPEARVSIRTNAVASGAVLHIGNFSNEYGTDRNALALCADAPRMYFSVPAPNLPWKIAVQDTLSGGMEFAVANSASTDATAATYGPIMALLSTGSVGIATSAPVAKLDVAGGIAGLGTVATLPAFQMGSERSLGWFRSAVSTIKQSYGSFDLTAANLSVKTTATSMDSTTVPDGGIQFYVGGTSGASIGIRSGGTLYWFSSSASTKG